VIGSPSNRKARLSIFSGAQPVSADYHREKAEEIRYFARRCRFFGIAEKLLELGERFDRAAAEP